MTLSAWPVAREGHQPRGEILIGGREKGTVARVEGEGQVARGLHRHPVKEHVDIARRLADPVLHIALHHREGSVEQPNPRRVRRGENNRSRSRINGCATDL